MSGSVLMEKGANYSRPGSFGVWRARLQSLVSQWQPCSSGRFIRQREVHSGMIVSEFPLESVSASVEPKVSPLPVVAAPVPITDFTDGDALISSPVECAPSLFLSHFHEVT